MSLKRECYFCGKPVDIHRRMSTFCSARCEALEKSLPGAENSPHPANPPAAPLMIKSGPASLTGK